MVGMYTFKSCPNVNFCAFYRMSQKYDHKVTNREAIPQLCDLVVWKNMSPDKAQILRAELKLQALILVFHEHAG